MTNVRVYLTENLPHGIGKSFAGSAEEITIESYGVVYQRKHNSTIVPWRLVQYVDVEGGEPTPRPTLV